MRHTHKPQPKSAARSRANHLLWAFVIEPLLSGVLTLLLLGDTGVLSFYLCGGGKN